MRMIVPPGLAGGVVLLLVRRRLDGVGGGGVHHEVVHPRVVELLVASIVGRLRRWGENGAILLVVQIVHSSGRVVGCFHGLIEAGRGAMMGGRLAERGRAIRQVVYAGGERALRKLVWAWTATGRGGQEVAEEDLIWLVTRMGLGDLLYNPTSSGGRHHRPRVSTASRQAATSSLGRRPVLSLGRPRARSLAQGGQVALQSKQVRGTTLAPSTVFLM